MMSLILLESGILNILIFIKIIFYCICLYTFSPNAIGIGVHNRKKGGVSMSNKPISRSLPPLIIKSMGDKRTLFLRPLDVTDCVVIRKVIKESGEHLKRFMPWAHLDPTLEESVLLISNWRAEYFSGRAFHFGIFDQKDNAFLGMIGLVPGDRLNANCWEVGYWVAKPRSKQGIGTHALKTIILLSFHCFDVDRLEVLSQQGNDSSRRLIEKCGFVLEGELRNIHQKPTNEMIENGYSSQRNALMFSLIPEEYNSLSWAPEMMKKIQLIPIQADSIYLSEYIP